MRRRDLLVAAGVTLGSSAGCIGPPGANEPSPASPTDTPAFDPDRRFETVRIGDRTGEIIPHQVGIWNADVEPRSIQVTVFDESAGASRHKQTHEFPADSALNVELRAPARYRLTIRLPDDELERSFSVDRSYFDTCNDSYSHVSVRQSGRITVRTLSTELACQTATA